MEKKNYLIKNIFYIFLTICFLGAGFFVLHKSTACFSASALDTSFDTADENTGLENYFLQKEYLANEDGSLDENESSLIGDGIFMYYNETGNNLLKLFVSTNGVGEEGAEVYNYVYYPNPEDKSTFYFFNFSNLTLSINGEVQTLPADKKYINTTNFTFANYNDALFVQTFSMVFDKDGTRDDAFSFMTTAPDGETRILNEGLYTVSFNITPFLCTNGKNNGTEDAFAEQKTIPVKYSFYVVGQDSYFENNRPILKNKANFDTTINSDASQYAFELYSNFTSKGEADQIPFIEYDFSRYELEISKEYQNEIQTTSLLFDKEQAAALPSSPSGKAPISQSGTENLVHFVANLESHTCKVYFTDIGAYTIKMHAIKLVEKDGTVLKYALGGLDKIKKDVSVHMFGFQATYTDFDEPANANNIRPTKEMKEFDFENGAYESSADLTSRFVNSNPDFNQASTSTFTIRNIVGFLNNPSNNILPVKTNQTPVKFSTNGTTLENGEIYHSWILTTNNLSGYSASGSYLKGQMLYQKTFTGQSENTVGTYVYVIAYKYGKHANAGQVFYQIFYFEIEKGSPSVSITSQDSKESVFSNTFINQNAVLCDTTKNDPFNKDVTVQIYATDYNNQNAYMTEFGGVYGISLGDITSSIDGCYTLGEDGSLTLLKNAHYTIRLYYTSDINGHSGTRVDTNIANTSGFCSQQYFTIDKQQIEEIVGRNVAPMASEYQILNDMEDFATNQSMVVSWKKKASGASSHAYYRYFPLIDAQYYSTNKDIVSDLLSEMINQSNIVFPVNSILNLGAKNSWNPLAKNTSNGGNSVDFKDGDEISSEYVLSDAGLYLIEIQDAAGNKKTELFFVDNTSPVFVIRNDEGEATFELTSGTHYIDKTSTLFWGDFKGIYITGFNTSLYADDAGFSPDNLPNLEEFENNNFYLDQGKNLSTEIFLLMHQLKKRSCMKLLDQLETEKPSEITALSSYNGMYLTIQMNDLSYYADDNTKGEYIARRKTESTGNTTQIKVEDNEITYRIVVRDFANTKRDLTLDKDARIQYTNYYSARQTIRVSFDTSKFAISFKNANNEMEELTSFITDTTGTEAGADITSRTKTTYLSPTSLQKAFTLSFIPTTKDTKTTQVDSVTIDYYRYKTESFVDENGVKFYYNTLSKTAERTLVYSLAQHGEKADTFTSEIGISNTQLITNPGKYVISRTYKYDDTNKYSINAKDFFKRTFILIVDRHEVVTSPEQVPEGGHAESLVGGDIFVSMFDSGKNSNVVVTFPNSNSGNTDGQTIYNNGTVRTILTTNKLPVKLYVPQYKYTTYVSTNKTFNSAGEETGYDFEVNYNFDEQNDTMNNFTQQQQIREYALYAQLYKNGTLASNLIATTAFRNASDPGIDDIGTDGHGFMKFYTTGSNPVAVEQLTEAGEYYVKIFQGRFGTEQGENGYQQFLTFKFEIKKAAPDFTVKLEEKYLNSQSADPITSGYSEIYYTNQSEVCLTWDASTDDYMVQIDVDKISLKAGNNTYNTSSDIWTIKPYEQDNHTYFAKLNLEKLAFNNSSTVYVNNGFVDITMEFENHSSFYDKVTKRVFVDLSAPRNNINTLVSNTTANTAISSLNEGNLRTLLTAKNSTPRPNVDEISYDISNDEGNFAYYSFAVDGTYLSTLKRSQDFKTYIRSFTDADGHNTKYVTEDESIVQETSPYSFLPSSGFTELNEMTALLPNTYYEVVETDRAGNMAIYTIFVSNLEGEVDIISYEDANGNKHSYTQEDYQRVRYEKSNGKGKAIHNIYSKTGFKLTDINFFGDAWAEFTLVTRTADGTSTLRTLMLSPYEKGYALAYVGNEPPQRIAISSLINGALSSAYKNSLTINNKTTLEKETFYITIYSTSLSASMTDKEDEEYIRFKKVADDEVHNTDVASTYVTQISITADGTTIYSAQNPLGYATILTTPLNVSGWRSGENIDVRFGAANSLDFVVKNEINFSPNTRIVYEFKDNYGTTYKEIHLFHETMIPKEITSSNDIYSFRGSEGLIYYITTDDFNYTFNPNKYDVQVFDFFGGANSTTLEKATAKLTPNSNGTATMTVCTKVEDENGDGFKDQPYNDTFVVEIRDHNDATNLIKEIHFVLYNQLPLANDGNSAFESGQFRILDGNGNNITNKVVGTLANDETGYFSEVRVMFNQSETFIPVKFSVSRDKQTWEEISSGTRLRSTTDEMEKYYLKIWYDQQYLKNESGNAMYVFEKVPTSQIFEFNLSSLTATYWVEKTINGVSSIVENSNTIFQTSTGQQYSNHYIINLPYAQKDAVEIKVNKEQEIEKTLVDPEHPFVQGSVVSELWKISNKSNVSSNIPAFETFIVLTYIPTSDNFVEEFFASNADGLISDNNLISLSPAQTSVVIPKDSSNVDTVKLRWSKFYGIHQNEINIKIVKDGIELKNEIYTETSGTNQYNYTHLSLSGKYLISLYDKAGNVQKFNFGSSGQSEVFTFTFLKDVPFMVTYTDPSDSTEKTTLPINQAVFNKSVTLKIDERTLQDFYMLGGYPKISVMKNGQAYEKTFADNTTSFTFDEAGYYEVSFSATSKENDVGEIRQEKFQFTIVNPEEHKISYVYNRYSNYYVQRVLKDGVDITQDLLKTLDVETITVGKQVFMTQLPLSFLDEKTGVGTYTITVNSNNLLFENSGIISSWTYTIKIYRGQAPIQISVGEGKATTKKISITFNQENIYAEMGECKIRVVRHSSNGFDVTNEVDINAQSTGAGEIVVENNNTYYVQIVSPSGTLLFSYKIVKKAPLNAAAIIAIVISAVVLVAVIIIIIKLRKRISVK